MEKPMRLGAMTIPGMILFLNLASVSAQNTDPLYESYFDSEVSGLPVRGSRLFDTASFSSFQLAGGPAGTKLEKIKVEGLPFSIALKLTVPGPGANSWEPQFMTANNSVPAARGDVLFYIFYMRCASSADASGKGKALGYVQLSRSPWSGLGSLDFNPGTEWRKYYLTAVAGEDFAKGDVQITFHLGYFAQVLEIGGFIALNLGKVNQALLPFNRIGYDGQESNAAWRQAAAARIEQFRKGGLTVSVKRPSGETVPNAAVSVRMKRHAYGFGTFIETLTLKSGPDAEKYRSALFQYFNKITTPFYWGGETGDWGWESPGQAEYRKDCLDLAAWEKENGFRIRGHNLVWPSWTWLPPRIKGLADDPQALAAAVDAHVREIAGLTKRFGFEEWDVVNEPYFNHDLLDILGDDAIVEWFEAVHAVDPAPSLVINETGDITGGGHAQALDNLARLTELLQSRGAPLGGLGFQAHFSSNLTPIPRVLEILDRFAGYGLPLRITEFDIDTRDELTQADYTRDLITAWFSHPSTDNFTMWGFWEGQHWKPNAAMLRTNWAKKPNAVAYADLVLGRWWTDTTAVTDGNGELTIRGFLGDYSVSAVAGGDTAAADVRLERGGSSVELFVQSGGGVSGFFSHPPYPNPARATARFGLYLPESAAVTVELFDVNGRSVWKRSAALERGFRVMDWPAETSGGGRPASGVYAYRLTAAMESGTRTRCGKLVFLK
jgi:endo-1,4-beta-xylanase